MKVSIAGSKASMIGCVLICAVIHLCVEVGEVFRGIVWISSQELLYLIFTEGVCIGTLLGVGASTVVDPCK